MNGYDSLVNLTPHEVVIRPDAGCIIRLPACAQPARLIERTVEGGHISHLMDYAPVVCRSFAGIAGLPDPIPGKVYIVSMPVAQFARRADVVSPDTGAGVIRDEDGKIIAVKNLVRWEMGDGGMTLHEHEPDEAPEPPDDDRMMSYEELYRMDRKNLARSNGGLEDEQ